MCDSALVAEKKAPSKALFVDYANLPDAVPEFVFPEHFGMAAEVAEVSTSMDEINMFVDEDVPFNDEISVDDVIPLNATKTKGLVSNTRLLRLPLRRSPKGWSFCVVDSFNWKKFTVPLWGVARGYSFARTPPVDEFQADFGKATGQLWGDAPRDVQFIGLRRALAVEVVLFRTDSTVEC